jgi:F0F1-type ATP synthase alpha subunit
VFNVHAALLERAGKAKWICGNGSITAFPIIETINCDVTEYIATNLISITDGQIYTNSILFKNGYRPAVDSGLSVSRVGSSAQNSF